MASDSRQEILANLKSALKLDGLEPDDQTLWAIVCAMAQLSEALHGVYLHRNCDPRYAAVVMMIQRAGRLAHKLRDDAPARGSVEFVERYVDDELAQALGYLLMAAQERPSLQARSLKWSRELVKLSEVDDLTDLAGDADEEALRKEMKEWEALSVEALDLFERDLEADGMDAGGGPADLDRSLPDAGHTGGSVGHVAAGGGADSNGQS